MKFSIIATLVVVLAVAHSTEARTLVKRDADFNTMRMLVDDMKDSFTSRLQDMLVEFKTLNMITGSHPVEKLHEQMKPFISNLKEQIRPIMENVDPQLRPLAHNFQAQVQPLAERFQQIFQEMTDQIRALVPPQ